ncbi:AAA family ATPase [Pseudomonas fluorescens]|uniref:AAA family ATPase n=1 Tax=Pseudomonas fluorescens TaxID=294 RepID=UPI0009996AB0|nr:AAA family ATPase [Pseudomonas fluorescens]OPB33815.1 hypothetical protein BFW90_04165 [Pseudomonas fluorescens]
MLDEREVIAARVVRELEKISLTHDKINKHYTFHAALYLIAAHCINWDSSKWREEWIEYYSYDEEQAILARAKILTNYYSRQFGHASAKLPEFSKFKLIEHIINKACASAGFEENIFLYDHIFYIIVSSCIKIDRQHSSAVTALVSGLKREMGGVDYYLYSGESFLHDQFSAVDPQYHFYPKNTTPYQDLVFLRLAMYDIEPVAIETGLRLPDSNLFGVLDILPRFSAGTTSMHLLAEILAADALPNKLLVIVDKTDKGSSATTRKEIKEALYEGDLLEAIIDFTSFDLNGKPKRLSAWLLNKSKNIRHSTLCVNISHMPNTENGITTEDTAWFAAALVDLWSSEIRFRPGRYPKVMSGPLKNFFVRSLENKSKKVSEIRYKDIPAICKVVSSEEFYKRAISVAPHLSEPTNNYYLLSIEPVMELFIDNLNSPVLAYIIGNNGAGKSLLLSNLIESLGDLDIPMLGVSSGAADRFTSKHPMFIYCGESRGSGRSDKVIARNLLKSLIKIIYRTDLWDAFTATFDLIHLKHRLYMVREDATDEMLRTSDNSQLIIELSRDNRGIIKGVGSLQDFEPALMRDDSSRIVRFKNLSSGEQCMVLMLVKIMSNVRPGAVVLVDEPEISLHVHWQQMLPQLFEVISERLGCSFVIATHSPTVVTNIGNEMSHCFLAKEGFLTPIPPEQRHSVETILLEGFKVYTPHNREVHERCAALVSQAIREVNAPGRLDMDKQQLMLEELVDIAEIINSSGNNQEYRSQQDINLVEQAKLAIKEIYDLAAKEL